MWQAVRELIAVSEHQRRAILGALAASQRAALPPEAQGEPVGPPGGAAEGPPPFRLPGKAVLSRVRVCLNACYRCWTIIWAVAVLNLYVLHQGHA